MTPAQPDSSWQRGAMAGSHPDYGNKKPLEKQKRNVQSLGGLRSPAKAEGALGENKGRSQEEVGGGAYPFSGGGLKYASTACPGDPRCTQD